MWFSMRRGEIWDSLIHEWDILIIGGGITGAGIFREAVRAGYHTLLVDKKDFAWGTSSRSTKLVHGGLRYLKQGKVSLTRMSIKERDILLEEAPGLIDPLGFLLTVYEREPSARWIFEAGLTIYELLALQWGHQYYDANDFRSFAPYIKTNGLEGGFRYGDAKTDDSRLVLRVIREAVRDGGVAINYVNAKELIIKDNQVKGLVLADEVDKKSIAIFPKIIVNATGAWADRLRGEINMSPKLRPLRGSHLIFPSWRLPVAQAVSFLHPYDGRPVMILPWEGITLVGTTDVDHYEDLDIEPSISQDEIAYLMAAVESVFPSLNITIKDILSTFSGVRPVIGTGKINPSEESRDHIVLDENGLITVTGGKLTTFRRIALDTLKVIEKKVPPKNKISDNVSVLNQIEKSVLDNYPGLSETCKRKLVGRYGEEAPYVIDGGHIGENQYVPGSKTLWSEIRWGAKCEGVIHLDDLLLRRVRLGLTLGREIQQYYPKIEEICHEELGWNKNKWVEEKNRYEELWLKHYFLPPEISMKQNHIKAESMAYYKKNIKTSDQAILNIRLIGSATLFILFLISTIIFWIYRLKRLESKDHMF